MKTHNLKLGTVKWNTSRIVGVCCRISFSKVSSLLPAWWVGRFLASYTDASCRPHCAGSCLTALYSCLPITFASILSFTLDHWTTLFDHWATLLSSGPLCWLQDHSVEWWSTLLTTGPHYWSLEHFVDQWIHTVIQWTTFVLFTSGQLCWPLEHAGDHWTTLLTGDPLFRPVDHSVDHWTTFLVSGPLYWLLDHTVDHCTTFLTTEPILLSSGPLCWAVGLFSSGPLCRPVDQFVDHWTTFLITTPLCWPVNYLLTSGTLYWPVGHTFD